MIGYLRSTTALALAIGVSAAAAHAGGLPTGGKFASGKGSIKASGGGMTISQSSSTGIINWKTFSLGKSNSIVFDNGSGTTLNKVTGNGLSTIAGSLHATGTVYLTNSAGVIVSSTGKIVTGGTFIATSGSIANDPHDSELTDIANAKKKVTNAGSITSSSGNVFLVGNTAGNTGTITAKKDDAVVAAASKMAFLLNPVKAPAFLFEQQVGVEAGTGNATNTGNITGATAEVAAYGGTANAGKSKKAGTVAALGAKNDPAAVWVISVNGKTSVGGNLKTAAGGAIETVAGTSFGITGKISAGKGGRWDTDASSITVNSTQGNLINTALKAGTNVSLNTENPIFSLFGKNIVINGPISWSTNATLSIVSNGTITFDKSINVNGAGTMTFGSHANGGYGEWHFANGSSLNFGTANKGAKLQIQGLTYTLIYNAAQLQNINNNLGGNYALAKSIDASGASSWIPIGTDGAGNPIATPLPSGGSAYGFYGFFDGLGHTVNNLSINLPDVNDVGLFGYAGNVRDVGIVGGTIAGGGNVGALIGEYGQIYPLPVEYVFSTATVEGTGDDVGGLIGWTGGSIGIDNAYATGNVSGNSEVGGLIGLNGIAVSNSYATGSVTGNDEVGGLIGAITASGNVSYSYATGLVSSPGTAGGLIGKYGDSVVTDGYWDTETSGQAASAGGLGLTTAQLEHALPAGFSSSTWGFVKNKSMPYLLWQASGTGSRPEMAARLTNAEMADAPLMENDLLPDKKKIIP